MKSQFTVQLGCLDHPQVLALLNKHIQNMAAVCPSETNHVASVEELNSVAVTFFTAWEEDKLLGCIALKKLADGDAELKSLRTAEAARGKGVAKQLLDSVITFAKTHNVTKLMLETGSSDDFIAARALFEKAGFSYRAAYGDYPEHPTSVFLEKRL